MMPVKREMLVRRDALTHIAVNETVAPVPGAGEVLLEIESFAVTANNVTYAVVGEQVGYWNFFPALEGWGIVPVWGFARVIASQVPEIVVGERLYGYLPMASHLIVQPGKISAGLFRDMAAHRQPMSPVYNQYHRLAADPAHDPSREDMRMLFEPLFLTSFLIEDTLRRAAWHGADSVVMTSASSKTALGTAYVGRESSPTVRRIGLTNASNVAFVERTGLYDVVLAYDAIDTVAEHVGGGSAVVIDFAGNADVVASLYTRLSGRLAQCLRVGVTHHAERGEGGILPGPKPVWFFAPNAATALIREIGQDAFNAAVATRWRGFIDTAATLVSVAHDSGMQALERIWRAQVAGQARPDIGYVLCP
ncbi:DUF2855 family protein [Sphingomonas sp. MMS24-J45]|uniref:DUF2855 family protein n=1 Tax=Sphingomonas sp. MMS24-J45 TaxID=3238806 RepID=UPI00384E7F96